MRCLRASCEAQPGPECGKERVGRGKWRTEAVTEGSDVTESDIGGSGRGGGRPSGGPSLLEFCMSPVL